jgi:hypothetical protein
MGDESIGTGTELDRVEKVSACRDEHDEVSVYDLSEPRVPVRESAVAPERLSFRE